MKKTIILSLLHLLIFSNSYSQSKECDCSAALSESLKDKYTDNQLLDLRIELYEYYKVIQNKSKNENVAFNLSSAAKAYTSHGIFNGSSAGNGDYEKNKIQNLEKIIEKEQSISNQVFRQMATDVFSGNQLEAYKACLSSCPKQNGVFYEVSGSLDDVFAINLYFTNNLGQPKSNICNQCNSSEL